MLTLHPFPFMSEVQAVLHEAIYLPTQYINGYAACLSRAILLGNKKLKQLELIQITAALWQISRS